LAQIPLAGLMLSEQDQSEEAGLAAPPAVPAQEQEAAIETGGYQAIFHIPGRVTVAGNEGAKSFRISTRKIAPDLLVRATPTLDETAYLEATLKHVEEAPLLPGRVSVYRDGIFVGRSQMPLTPKDETLRLGFGADEKVKVARVVTRKLEGSAGLISSAKTDEREFKITLRSGHDGPIKAVIGIRCRPVRRRRFRWRCSPSPRSRPNATCATGAACSPGALRWRPGRRRRSGLAGGCAGPATRSSLTNRAGPEPHML
jgi:hypothetical protein